MGVIVEPAYVCCKQALVGFVVVRFRCGFAVGGSSRDRRRGSL